MWVLLLALVSISSAVCPGTLNVSLEMSSETVQEVGENLRRADVLIFIPVEKRLIKEEISVLESSYEVRKEGDGLFHIGVIVRNRTNLVSESGVLEQPVGEGSGIEGNIEAKRIISRLPYMFEPLALYPTDIKPGTVIVKLPTIRPGEELEIYYRIRGEAKEPVVRSLEKLEVEKDDRLYVLVGKYSLIFSYGSTRARDLNLENLKEVIRGLELGGLKPIVRIVGMSDGKTKNPKRNKEVAEERARFVAKELLGENFACYVRRAYAEKVK